MARIVKAGWNCRALNAQNSPSITDQVLSSFRTCKFIERVDISGCLNVTEHGIQEFARVHPMLQTINLASCPNLGDEAVRMLVGWCRRLDTLNMQNCVSLTDIGLRSFNQRPPLYSAIQHIDFSGCRHISDAGVLEMLGSSPALRSLSLAGCHQVTGMAMFALTRLRPGSLTSLNIAGIASLQDAELSWVAQSSSGLTSLCLQGCAGFTDHSLRLLALHCTSLQRLNLAGSSITDTGLCWLVGLPAEAADVKAQQAAAQAAAAERAEGEKRAGKRRYRALHKSAPPQAVAADAVAAAAAAATPVSPTAAARRALFRGYVPPPPPTGTGSGGGGGGGGAAQGGASTQSFFFEQLPTQQIALGKDGGCRQLRQLNLGSVTAISAGGIHALATVCPFLTDLGLSRGSRQRFLGKPFTSAAIAAVTSACPRLTCLNLSGSIRLTDDGVAHFARQLRQLRQLQLSGLPHITDESLRTLGMRCAANLETLHLADCQKLTNLGLHALLFRGKCTSLTTLNVQMCRGFSDVGLQALVKCPNLASLNLASMPAITGDGLAIVLKKCTNLSHLNVTKSLQVRMDHITPYLPHLPLADPASRPVDPHDGLKPAPKALYRALLRRARDTRAAISLQRSFRIWQRSQATMAYYNFKAVGLERIKFFAALSFQKVWRGYLGRCRWKAEKRHQDHLAHLAYLAHLRLINAMAVLIQCMFRQFTARRELRIRRTRRHAAIQIQRLYRGHRARRLAKKLARARWRERTAAQAIVRLKHRTLISCLWAWHMRAHPRAVAAKMAANCRRRWQLRVLREYRRVVSKARMTRYVFASNTVKKAISAGLKHQLLRVSAAVTIQNAVRSRRARNVLHYARAVRAEHDRLILLQRTRMWRRMLWHMVCEWHRLTEKMNRVRALVQRHLSEHARRVLMRWRWFKDTCVEERRQLHQASALHIQRVYRGMVGRRRFAMFQRMKRVRELRKGRRLRAALHRRQLQWMGAALIIQQFARKHLFWRRCQRYQEYCRWMAARKIQKNYRAMLGRVAATTKRVEYTASSLTIQRVYRGHVGRVAFNKAHNAWLEDFSARLIQRVYRGHVGRCYFRDFRTRSNAGALAYQRVFRGHKGRQRAAKQRLLLELKNIPLRKRLLMTVGISSESHPLVKTERALISKYTTQVRVLTRLAEFYVDTKRTKRQHLLQVGRENAKLRRHIVGLTEAVYDSDAKLGRIVRAHEFQRRKNKEMRKNMQKFPGIMWGKVKVMRVLEQKDFWGVFDKMLTDEALSKKFVKKSKYRLAASQAGEIGSGVGRTTDSVESLIARSQRKSRRESRTNSVSMAAE